VRRAGETRREATATPTCSIPAADIPRARGRGGPNFPPQPCVEQGTGAAA
jgi:hypothetical protein